MPRCWDKFSAVACSTEQRLAPVGSALHGLDRDVPGRLQLRAVKEAEEKADQELDVLMSDLSGLLNESLRPKPAKGG